MSDWRDSDRPLSDEERREHARAWVAYLKSVLAGRPTDDSEAAS